MSPNEKLLWWPFFVYIYIVIPWKMPTMMMMQQVQNSKKVQLFSELTYVYTPNIKRSSLCSAPKHLMPYWLGSYWPNRLVSFAVLKTDGMNSVWMWKGRIFLPLHTQTKLSWPWATGLHSNMFSPDHFQDLAKVDYMISHWIWRNENRLNDLERKVKLENWISQS